MSVLLDEVWQHCRQLHDRAGGEWPAGVALSGDEVQKLFTARLESVVRQSGQPSNFEYPRRELSTVGGRQRSELGAPFWGYCCQRSESRPCLWLRHECDQAANVLDGPETVGNAPVSSVPTRDQLAGRLIGQGCCLQSRRQPGRVLHPVALEPLEMLPLVQEKQEPGVTQIVCEAPDSAQEVARDLADRTPAGQTAAVEWIRFAPPPGKPYAVGRLAQSGAEQPRRERLAFQPTVQAFHTVHFAGLPQNAASENGRRKPEMGVLCRRSSQAPEIGASRPALEDRPVPSGFHEEPVEADIGLAGIAEPFHQLPVETDGTVG